MRLVLSLDTEIEQSPMLTGGKGHTLIRLRRAGFPVPPGFVVTTEAFRFAQAAESVTDRLSIPPDVREAILQSYGEMGNGAVAVRSSAVNEDGARVSYAGQFSTTLNVIGEEALLDAVKQCWLSSMAAQACDAGSSPAMAVVVQRMAPALYAGVSFTTDPLTGAGNTIVVEAVPGLADRLLQGEVVPRRYMWVEGSTEAAGDDLLDDETLEAVVNLAIAVRDWAGTPQDVEWTWDTAGRPHLLQARPITADASGPVIRWTQDNVGEVIQEPVTPLSWSVLDPLYHTALEGVFRWMGLRARSSDLFALRLGRVYMNFTLFQWIFQQFYLSQAKWNGLLRLMATGLRACWLLIGLPRRSRRLMMGIRAFPPPNLNRSSNDLLVQAEEWFVRETKVMRIHLAVTILGMLLCQLLEKFMGSEVALILLSRATTTESAEAGVALAALARRVNASDSLRKAALETAQEDRQKVLSQFPEGQAFLVAMEAFLQQFGHRASEEFELAAPRWREDPAPVWAALEAQVRSMEISPQALEQPSAGVLTGLHPARVLSRSIRTFSTLRENLKETLILSHGCLRDLYGEMGRRMAEVGALAHAEDVFFLVRDEISDLIKGKSRDLHPLVVRRRDEWERWGDRIAPFALEERFDGRLVPQERGPAGKEGVADLRGVAASPGQIVGPAFVACKPTDVVHMGAGSILVTPALTPGWAPALQAAGAVVTEIGGMLSHGAIIAREYGVPAVLNVANATTKLRNGQLVYVDGSKGVVTLMDDAMNRGEPR